MSAPFSTHREAALAVLNGESRLTRKAASRCVADPMPLSALQREWLDGMLDRAGLPALAREAA